MDQTDDPRALILAALRARGGFAISGNRESWSDVILRGGRWIFRRGDALAGGVPELESELSDDEVLARWSNAVANVAGIYGREALALTPAEVWRRMNGA